MPGPYTQRDCEAIKLKFHLAQPATPSAIPSQSTSHSPSEGAKRLQAALNTNELISQQHYTETIELF